ncbi:MAG TPA: hypothetical protein EYP60_03585 [bacterium (Candidatus Stahlbacteria)]|nr:hypothetical protein [Candidatus Stahlbacteria bacterium]
MKQEIDLDSVRKRVGAALKYFGVDDQLSVEMIESWFKTTKNPIECFRNIMEKLKPSTMKEASSALILLQQLWNLTPLPELRNRSPKEIYMLGKEFGVPVNDFGLRDIDVLDVNLVKDFNIFIDYVEKYDVKLTEIGNICLRDLKNINSMLSVKVEWERFLGNRVYRVRSENELPYILTLDTIARSINLVKEQKRRLIPTPTMKKFNELSFVEKYGVLLEAYVNSVNWEFLHPTYGSNETSVAEIMQDNFDAVALLLLRMHKKVARGWLKVDAIVAQVADFLGLGTTDKADVVSGVLGWEVKKLIMDLFTLFDLVEIEQHKDEWGLEQPIAIRLNRKGARVLTVFARRAVNSI